MAVPKNYLEEPGLPEGLTLIDRQVMVFDRQAQHGHRSTVDRTCILFFAAGGLPRTVRFLLSEQQFRYDACGSFGVRSAALMHPLGEIIQTVKDESFVPFWWMVQ